MPGADAQGFHEPHGAWIPQLRHRFQPCALVRMPLVQHVDGQISAPVVTYGVD